MPKTPSRPDAFEAELLALAGDLDNFARSLTRDAERAADLVQETFVRALSCRHQLRPGTSLRAWAFTILRNFHYAQWRKQSRMCAWHDGMEEHMPASGGQEAAATLSRLFRDFLKLPRRQQEALAMVGVSGCSYEEAATLAACPPGTIKSRVCRARASLEAGMRSARQGGERGFGEFLEYSMALVPAPVAGRR